MTATGYAIAAHALGLLLMLGYAGVVWMAFRRGPGLVARPS